MIYPRDSTQHEQAKNRRVVFCLLCACELREKIFDILVSVPVPMSFFQHLLHRVNNAFVNDIRKTGLNF